MISGATQSGFHFLQQHINFPSNISVEFDPHKLINSTKQIKILWAHYAHDQPIFLNVNWDKITHIVCVSNWQQSQFIKYLNIPKHKISVIRNGGADYFNYKEKTNKTLIYASTPFRGLKYLPYIFKQVLKQHPDAILKVFSGMQLYGDQDTQEFKEIYKELQNTPNTYYSEPIAHTQLAEEFKQASLLVYPNTWEETSCVTLIEALRSGCYPIISDIGALPETANKFGTIVPMDAIYHSTGWIPNKQFLNDFAENICNALSDNKYKHTIKQSRWACEYYSWSNISKEWYTLFNKLLTNGNYMKLKKTLDTKNIISQTGNNIVQDEKILSQVFNEIFRWENEDKEHAQGRSNFQIEKFITLDNYTIASAFNAMLKNRRIMAEGLFSKITEMKEHQREFDYKWDNKNKEEPIQWPTKDGGTKLCWNDLDALNLQNFLKSSELEIRDRIQQIETFDKILNKLIEQNGGPITREQFEEQDHIYWERRLANQAMDDIISRNTGIGTSNIYSMRRASAPTLLPDDVNRVKNPFPDLGKALAGGELGVEFLLDLQKKVLSGIEEVTSNDLQLLANEQVTNRIGIEKRLDRIHSKESTVEKQQHTDSPKSLFNDKWNTK